MTLDEAIRHCEEVAERYDRVEDSHADDKLKQECIQCAADHRQLAEWLTELKKAKRLLKAAVEDMNNGGCNSNCYKCKHCGECDFSERFTWKHTDETEKLLGDSENEY